MKPENDISIGPDRWLGWIDLGDPSTFSAAVEMDDLLEPCFALWDALETHCVAGCCGISAFNLWPGSIRRALAGSAREKAARDLRNAQARLGSMDARLVVSDRLNQYFDRGLFIRILEHVCAALEE